MGGGAGRLDQRDHALATEISLGCLRRQGEVDALLEEASGRSIVKFDPEVRAALRIGCYQLCYLDRIPPRAAVSESVELVKMARKTSAAGLVNAVLRRVPAMSPQTDEGGRSGDTTLALNYPAWMVKRWQENFGAETTFGIMRAGIDAAPTYLRLNPAFDPSETQGLLSSEGVETKAMPEPLALLVVSGKVHQSRCLAEGRCRIQDVSSQRVVPLLELEPRHTFLDLCAAPGGKTFQAIDVRGGSRGVVAADRHLHRLRTLHQLAAVPTAASLTVRGIDSVVLDARQPLPFRRTFDRILVDAPCSGTGTLARNPEIKWRLRPDDISELAAKQGAILCHALDFLAPGGILVYSTCSLEPEENQQVIDTVRKEKTSFEPGAYFQRVPGREPGDGFFACQMRRRRGRGTTLRHEGVAP